MQRSQKFAAALLVLSTAALSACHMQPANTTAPHRLRAQRSVAHANLASVSLFPNGVGFFQYHGHVRDNARQILYFRSGQINDVLKSMVFQDGGGGKVSEAVFPSSQPLSVTLNSFLINLNGHPSLGALLQQLRGQRIALRMGGKYAGRIVGRLVDIHEAKPARQHIRLAPVVLSTRRRPRRKVKPSGMLNLYVGGRLLRVPLKNVQSVRVENPRLQKAFQKALAALAHQPNRHKRPVTLYFNGHGRRAVRFGYLLETPLWRMTYRLILPGKGATATLPHGTFRRMPERGGLRDHFPQTATLEAMAIVHNQTDMDWRHVRLHLVGMMPSSFYENLYQPLYIRRPMASLSGAISLRPETYGRGYASTRKPQPWAPMLRGSPAWDLQQKRLNAIESQDLAGQGGGGGAQQEGSLVQGGGYAQQQGELFGRSSTGIPEGINAIAGVQSMAYSSKAHPAYNYIIPNVSVRRQHSAMVVVLVTKLPMQRIDYYRPNQDGTHPMMAVRIHNTSGKYLLHGPVTVVSGGSYAGDARLSALAAKQKRILPFAVDQAVSINALPEKYSNILTWARLKKGTLDAHFADFDISAYRIRNQAPHARRLVIKLSADEKYTAPASLAALKPRHHNVDWTITVLPGQNRLVNVRQQGPSIDKESLRSMRAARLKQYARKKHMPPAVAAAIGHAARLSQGAARQTAAIKKLQARQVLLQAAEQNVRKDLRSLTHAPKVYDALANRLLAYEHKIEATFTLIRQRQRKAALLQAQLKRFWKVTNVSGRATP